MAGSLGTDLQELIVKGLLTTVVIATLGGLGLVAWGARGIEGRAGA